MKKRKTKLEVVRLKRGRDIKRRRRSAAIVWLVSIAMLLTVGLTGYMLFGGELEAAQAATNPRPPATPVLVVENETVGAANTPSASPEASPLTLTEIPEPSETPWPSDNEGTGGGNPAVTASPSISPGTDASKLVYLTFDDGPSKITPQVLDILKKENVCATFFIIGELAEQRPELIRRIADEGHQVANHSYNHVIKEVYASYSALKEQIAHTDQVIKDIIGEQYTPGYFRFPQGSHDKKAKPYVQKLSDEGFHIFDWNALNGDAEGKPKDVAGLIATFKETLGGKKKAVVLMHDAGAKQNTADALPQILRYLKEKNYEFRLIKDYDDPKGFY